MHCWTKLSIGFSAQHTQPVKLWLLPFCYLQLFRTPIWVSAIKLDIGKRNNVLTELELLDLYEKTIDQGRENLRKVLRRKSLEKKDKMSEPNPNKSLSRWISHYHRCRSLRLCVFRRPLILTLFWCRCFLKAHNLGEGIFLDRGLSL